MRPLYNPVVPEKTLEDILKIIDAIPQRMCGGMQPRFLYELSFATQGRGEIVEIGTCAGKSTIALAYGQQVKEDGKRIHTIDIEQHPDIIKNLKDADVSDQVRLIIERSTVLGPNWDQPIELLFIDADHRYKGIISDIGLWCKHVTPGGKVALHDYPGFEGVNDTWKAVYRCFFRRPNVWRVVADREAGSILVFERLKTDTDGQKDQPAAFNSVKWKINNLKWYFDELWHRIKKGKAEKGKSRKAKKKNMETVD